MFTGIIRHTGLFAGYGHGKQEAAVEAPGLAAQAGQGDSVAVDGTCLTVIRKDGHTLVFNLSQETIQRTTLGRLKPRQKLNLELPVTPAALLGGHLVMGHVDYRGRIQQVKERRPGRRVWVSLPREFKPFFIPKGSVAVNGVSLTVAGLGPTSFEVELIPLSLRETNLAALRPGDEVNVECDMIGKYVYNWLRQVRR